MGNSGRWMVVAIVCAVIVSTGVYCGLRQNRPSLPRAFNALQTSPAVIDQSTGQPGAPDRKESTVYATRTGTKYHRGHCGYLRSSRIPMPLSEAKKRYGPCGRCRPPR